MVTYDAAWGSYQDSGGCSEANMAIESRSSCMNLCGHEIRFSRPYEHGPVMNWGDGCSSAMFIDGNRVV